MSETVQSAEAERAGLLGVTFLDLNTNETARFAVPATSRSSGPGTWPTTSSAR